MYDCNIGSICLFGKLKHVAKLLKSLDTSKSVNGVPPVFFKECVKVIAKPLTKLFQCICKFGQYPSAWKISRVTPLHKKKSVLDPRNYRPVSVLPNISLIFERLLNSQLDEFMSAHIPQWQFGFTAGSGTDDYGVLVASLLTDVLERMVCGSNLK